MIVGPSGANLFVYHLPMSMTEEGLYALFCKYGVVLSTKVGLPERLEERCTATGKPIRAEGSDL